MSRWERSHLPPTNWWITLLPLFPAWSRQSLRPPRASTSRARIFPLPWDRESLLIPQRLRLLQKHRGGPQPLPAVKQNSQKDSNMAVTKAKKAEDIKELKAELEKASSMIVGTFSKLTV